MWQDHLTLDDLSILNSKREDHTHLLKPAQFAYLTKYIALNPRDFFFFPVRYQLKLQRTTWRPIPCVHPIFFTTVQTVLEFAYNDVI